MIRVIIDRHIAETLEGPYEQVARKILQRAFQAPGFISGESRKNARDPNHRVIISNWRSEQDWNQWYNSPMRKDMTAELQPMLESEEKVTVLELV